MGFEPIAIVGQGCVLPGGLDPEELWTTVRDGRDALGSPRPGYWGVPPAQVLRDPKAGPHLDHTWSDRGGYVHDFARTFDPHGLLVDAAELAGLDPLYQWTIAAARQAVDSAGWRAGDVPGSAGVVLANLSYPTQTMIDLAESVWRGAQDGIDWRNRFTSGFPAHLTSRALGLTGGAIALDAACASSLYAIKLACDRLHDHTADVMLAGGANGASDLFLHVGFSAIQALSPTGRSRPFHRGADGLVPAEGAAILALRRLDDAIADGDPILGVIKGIGLTNNGRGHGLLAPAPEGQERAMRLAYEMSGIEPHDISLVECHATGTARGDLTELTSMARVFAGTTDVPIGSVKSNLGHSLTASGAAGVIKVLAAMRAGIRPPTLHADEPLQFIADSPFRLLTEAEPWEATRPRRAALNNFGFGGNNAHLLLEEWVGQHITRPRQVGGPRPDPDIAVVGLSLRVGDGHDNASIAEHLRTGRPLLRDDGDGILRAKMADISVDLTRLRFPPNDLKEALPQQIALLSTALDLGELIEGLPSETTSVIVGMGCDAEVARFGLRWRLADRSAREAVVRGLSAAGVAGTMPNLVANRLNTHFDLRGPSYSVSSEQLSGTAALELAARALRRGEIDAAVVGAVDLSCEPVHEAAANRLLGADEQNPGDAAVVLILKTVEDARRDDDTILAVLPAEQIPRGDCLHLGNDEGAVNLSAVLGHAHAASGLLTVAVGVLFGLLGVRPDGTPWSAQERAIVVSLRGFGGQQQSLVVLPRGPGQSGADAALETVLRAASAQTEKSARLHFPGHQPDVVLPGHGNRSHQWEPDMPTRLPVPPALPKVEDAFARAPLGAALVQQTPPSQTSRPSSNRPDLEEPQLEIEDERAAQVEGFRFDHKAMAAWSNGKPSNAFGPRFQRFDNHRKMIRLPGPPYDFMSRVTEVGGDMGAMKSGADAVAEYDVLNDAWFFTANGQQTMPSAVLMEIALQPCGWLAAYIGCPLSTETDLYFRNLDGTGTQHAEVTPQAGTLRTTVTCKNVAKAADTIIVSFTAAVHAGHELVYTVDTVFGFFPREALEQQVGLPVTDEQRHAAELACEAPVIDLRPHPTGFFGPGARLADPMLLMIDRVTGRWPTGGSAGLGRWRAVKDVDPAEWFFKAHFYQDPVQPGSLGIEALLQLLEFGMLDLGLGDEAGPSARFEPVALHQPLIWRYRGQVLPTNKLITSLVEITRIERDDNGILAVADASLWVDGIRIYSAMNLAARIRYAEQMTQPAEVETVIDPARDTWITDHCPTFTSPTLPMTSVMDLFAQTAGRQKVVEITDLRVDRWIIVDSPKRLRVATEGVTPGRLGTRLEVWRDAPNPVLSRWETHAQATIVTADRYPRDTTVPAPPPLHDTVPLADPYETGAVFHGPAFFALMDGARISSQGASGRLSVPRCKVPVGRLHPGLLDAAMHLVPAGALSVWTIEGTDVGSYAEAKDPEVALPQRVTWARFYRDAPLDGVVDVETRFVGFDDADGRMPVIDVWLSVGDDIWAFIRVVGILLPKGPIGLAGAAERRAFLGERRAVPGLSLSEPVSPDVVALDSARVATLDWFKGTLQAAYGTESRGDALTVDIAVKEAVAHATHNAVHPSQVQYVDGQVRCPALPLERISVEVTPAGRGRFQVSASLRTDWDRVRAWWTGQLGMQQDWFGDLLKWALLSRYVRHVIVPDPGALAAVRGRPVLLLANHQVMIESILCTVLGSWLTDTRVVPIAGIKLQSNWIGRLTRLLDAVAGRDLGIMRYFDQQTPQQFFGLVDEIKRDTAAHGVSTLVHPDGTRYFHSGQRVEKLTSTLLDMAIEMSMPIVPVHFSGGLPEDPVDPKLEMPYRHAAQDYIFGPPIMPDELSVLPYALRRRRVIDAINTLAPFSDAPHPPNLAVENRIAAAAPGASPLESVWASIEDALNSLPVEWRDTIGSEWMAFSR